jgi:hypothetical protein
VKLNELKREGNEKEEEKEGGREYGTVKVH